MRKFTILIGVLVISMVSTGIAYAGELFTPPLAPTSLNGDNFAECVATNISDRTRDVLIQGFDSEGALAATLTASVDSNKTRGFSLSETPGPTGPVVFCKFSFRGSKDNFRAAIHVLDGGGEGTISALEAR